MDWILPAARNKVKAELVRPLSEAAQAVLADLPRVRGGSLVFSYDGRRPVSPTRPKVVLDRACGVSGWTLHDLRRTARTLMSRAGVSVDIGERALGHVIGGVRGVYDKHTFHPEMQRAFAALAALIERIVHPPEGGVVPLQRRARAEP
jgi:integrase